MIRRGGFGGSRVRKEPSPNLVCLDLLSLRRAEVVAASNASRLSYLPDSDLLCEATTQARTRRLLRGYNLTVYLPGCKPRGSAACQCGSLIHDVLAVQGR